MIFRLIGELSIKISHLILALHVFLPCDSTSDESDDIKITSAMEVHNLTFKTSTMV